MSLAKMIIQSLLVVEIVHSSRFIFNLSCRNNV